MGRPTSWWNATPAFLLLFLLMSPVDWAAVASKVIFPDAEACSLETGGAGRCLPLLDCPQVLQTFKQRPPVHCGFEGSTQLVCCPKDQDNTTRPGEPPQSQLDISPPSGYESLKCGRNAVIETAGVSFKSSLVSSLSPSRRSTSPGRQKRANLSLSSLNQPTVVGGIISTRAAWPWVALLGRRGSAGISWFCGGALINEYWVLSALHCFLNNKADVVRLGEHDYNNDNDGASHKDFSVADLVLYPDYKAPEAYHDLALLKLASKVTLQEFIRPVCLPWGKKSEENIVNNVTTVVGWGNTLYGGLPSTVLMQADVQVFPSSRCESTYSKLPHYRTTWPHGIGKETLCAGDPQGGKDACQGDSGGPLVSQDASGRYVAAGIVSRGYGCGHMDYPGLYANLRYPPYLTWLKTVAFGTQ